MLPDILKFPGASLEKSLDFFIEEYAAIDTTCRVIFIEVHRRGTPWLFQLDEDASMFDVGCSDLKLHKKVF